MNDDEEFQLAIEISKKTYAAEEELRRAEKDLIKFESPEEPQRRQKIDQIKKLYETQSLSSLPVTSTIPHNLSFGYIPSFDNSQSANATPHSTSFTNFSQISRFDASQPPPRPPKPPELHGFSPSPSTSLLRDQPPPLPPRANRSSLAISSTPFRHSAPTFVPFTTDLSPINQTPLNDSKNSNKSIVFSSSRNTNSQYQPLTHMYVPYTMINLNSSYGALLNGDLIDLSVPIPDETGNLSLDDIRKEFDPLWTLVESEMPPISVYQSKPLSETEMKSVNDNEKKEICSDLSISLIRLEKSIDPIKEQVLKIKKSSLIITEKHPYFFIAPTVNYMTTTATTVKVLIYNTNSVSSETKRCHAGTFDIDETISLITAKAVSTFGIHSIENEIFGLKIHGLNQFLSSDSELGFNLYTGHCLLHGEDIKLDLTLFAIPPLINNNNTVSWERMKSQLRYSAVLDKEDLENTIAQLELEMQQYEVAFFEGSTLRLSQTSQKVKQVVMLICKILHDIMPTNVYQHLQKYLAATTEIQLNNFRNDFLKELYKFIEIFCESTISRLKLPPLLKTEKPEKEAAHHNDHLQIILDSVHCIPECWIREYSEYYLSVDLYYGTQVLDGHSNRMPKVIKMDQFYPRIPLDLYAKFTRLVLCMYPRETRIVVSISGTLKSGAASQFDPYESTKMIAYCSVPLYNEQLFMRQGPMFLPLTILRKQPILKPFGPYPYIRNAQDPVLVMSLKVWDVEIRFPSISVDFQCIPQDFAALDNETQEYLMELIEKQDPSRLEEDDQELIWQKRSYLTNQPEALPLVLSSLSDWNYTYLTKVYQILEDWAPLRPEIALQLLLPQYPDEKIRSYAVKRLATGSTDFLYHSIPQFVEALRFELYENSSLAIFIFELASVSLDFTYEIYWQLQQRVDHCAVDDLPYAVRCQNLQQKIIDDHENINIKLNIQHQHELLAYLDKIQNDLRSRSHDSESERLSRLKYHLGILDSKLLADKVPLPICPSFDCTGIRIDECNIFNSNAKPLKLVFRGISANYSIIHKRDDDMRQDAFVMKMVNEMDRIWKSNGLDLRMITFRIMPVGYRRGMGQLVLNCATFLEIQKEEGLTGVLKDEVLSKWLMKHNNSEFTYKEALENFVRSCAGWCVVTYVLGIGDRHNDNILFTKNGHVFHIDFGKYMGDWQMAGGFRRDRVPFVFTSEMFYVINGGKTQTQDYQKFIDLCCKAFNYLRRNKNTLTNLLRLMACSDISGINIESISFVEKNLMLNLSETDATIQFTELIQNSLKSSSVRLNFVAHTVAQFVSSSSSFTKRDDNKLSFVPELYSMKTDGRLDAVRVITFEKVFIPSKTYLYKIEVYRCNVTVPSYIYRSFAEVDELHSKLRKKYPSLPVLLDSRTNTIRSNVRAVAKKRIVDVQAFFMNLFKQSDICHCELVYTFFHSLLRDNKTDTYSNSHDMVNNCQILLKIEYNLTKNTLNVFIGHVQNLVILQTGQMPDPYVKTYVRPDLQNFSKRKTQVVRATCNPVFNQELSYEHFPAEDLSKRVLEVSIWNNGGIMDNHKMYTVCIPLLKLHNRLVNQSKANRVLEGWFPCDKYI